MTGGLFVGDPGSIYEQWGLEVCVSGPWGAVGGVCEGRGALGRF